MTKPKPKWEPIAWDVYNGLCDISRHRTKQEADRIATELQKSHDLSGSWARFSVKPVVEVDEDDGE